MYLDKRIYLVFLCLHYKPSLGSALINVVSLIQRISTQKTGYYKKKHTHKINKLGTSFL